jgi:hypothetical protein
MKRNALYWVECVVDSVTFESIILHSRRNPKIIQKFYTDPALYRTKGDSSPFRELDASSLKLERGFSLQDEISFPISDVDKASFSSRRLPQHNPESIQFHSDSITQYRV